MFTKESLERLREKIDLIEAISGYVELKRSGASYKAICPFHQEKTPSFMVQKGDNHYHCFGCGAHGDAIQFLMSYLNLSFIDAVESLAERFQVPLVREDRSEEKEINKTGLKEAMTALSRFFYEVLLYTEEGEEALNYLYKRGLTIDFIRRFEVGLAPANELLFQKMVKGEKISRELLVKAGLLTEKGRPFFRDRITFPIQDVSGRVLGFSARKYKEETFGGKYINTPETPIFKKSRLLFGLNHCRRRIIREHRAIIVEGQIDCLKLIEAGLNLTLSALGTAFGESHVEEIKKLGARQVYLVFDADEAGQAAVSKVGNLFQKEGIEVLVVKLPKGSDPDSYLTRFGTTRFIEQLESAETYLNFQVAYLGKELNLDSPAGKSELVKVLKKQIEEWEEPVMVHESLRKVASLVQLPEEMIGVKQSYGSRHFVKEKGVLTTQRIDPNRVLELDLLRWLIYMEGKFHQTARTYIREEHFIVPACQALYQKIMEEENTDLLALASGVDDSTLIDEILHKKVNYERAETQFLETVQKILDRQWMQTREAIKMEIHSGKHSEEKILELAKQFDELKTQRPKVK